MVFGFAKIRFNKRFHKFGFLTKKKDAKWHPFYGESVNFS